MLLLEITKRVFTAVGCRPSHRPFAETITDRQVMKGVLRNVRRLAIIAWTLFARQFKIGK